MVDMSPMDAEIDSLSSTNAPATSERHLESFGSSDIGKCENGKPAMPMPDGKCLDQIHLADTPQECNEQNIVQWLAIV
jgi:hypothetical protein